MSKESQVQRYRARRAAGLCTRCSSPADKMHCSACAAKAVSRTKNYRKRHPDRAQELIKQQYQKLKEVDPEKLKARAKEYYEAHKEKWREYRRKNAEHLREYYRQRRAKKKASLNGNQTS